MVLENLSIKQRTTSAQAEARSLMVRRLRIILPLLAVCLIGVFFITSYSGDTRNDVFLDEFAEMEDMTEEMETSNLRFTGVDGNGKPYEITAVGATRKSQDDERFDLTNPRAVTHGDGDETVVIANAGVYEARAKVLELDQGVTLEHTVGAENYVLRTPAATVLIDEDRVETDTGVSGEDLSGNTLRADRMQAYQREGRVVFKGNVKLKIRSAADKKTDKDAGPSLRAGASAIRSDKDRSPE